MKDIYHYDEIDSTNDEAKRLLREKIGNAGVDGPDSRGSHVEGVGGSRVEPKGDGPDSRGSHVEGVGGSREDGTSEGGPRGAAELYGAVVIAKKQSAGRGRLGKAFESPGGDSLYATFIFEPPEDPAEHRITVFAAVAVCRALEQTTAYRPSIKGINDVIADGKKVCGILAESVPGAAILGIGVNINLREEDFSIELREIAGSLSMDVKTKERFFETLTDEVFRCMEIAVKPDSAEAIALSEEYRKRTVT